ncbi:Uncharacterized protein FWK35_00011014, partial [Aphis craccivora]
FIRSQRTKNCSKLIVCKRCLTSFGNKPCKSKLCGETELIRHKEMCIKNKLGRSIMFDEFENPRKVAVARRTPLSNEAQMFSPRMLLSLHISNLYLENCIV